MKSLHQVRSELRTFCYPGIERVDHVYFYTAATAPPETVRAYLDQAYVLGGICEPGSLGAVVSGRVMA
jgi:hypothetical protein